MKGSGKKARLEEIATAIEGILSPYGTYLTVVREWCEMLEAWAHRRVEVRFHEDAEGKQIPGSEHEVEVLELNRIRNDKEDEHCKIVEELHTKLANQFDSAIGASRSIAQCLGDGFDAPADRQTEVILFLEDFWRSMPHMVLMPGHVAGGIGRIHEDHMELRAWDEKSGYPDRLYRIIDWLRTAADVPLTGRKRRKRTRGRPEASSPDRDSKIVADWKASGLTKAEFERGRGQSSGEVRKAQDRLKARKRGINSN